MAPCHTTPAGLLARAEANGYKKEAHKEEDRVEDQRRHNDKMKKNQDRTFEAVCLMATGRSRTRKSIAWIARS
jgi:hypothetical protein